MANKATPKTAEFQPTAAQVRAARGLLNMSASQLAEETGLALNTIKRAERTNGPSAVMRANAKLLVETLERHGVVFINANAKFGPGVRLRLDSVSAFPGRRRRRPG
jgi:hypothetical protein